MGMITALIPQSTKKWLRNQARLGREARYSLDELGIGAWIRFKAYTRTDGYTASFKQAQPLVSICVATFNRAELLTQRCLPSLLRQTYARIEIIVVGDCCTDDTALRIAQLNDSRLRFINLPTRGEYPEDPYRRWMVAGTVPMNAALAECRGDFITHLDDDDEHAPDRVEKLVAFCQQHRLAFCWHPFDYETPEGEWQTNEAHEFAFRNVSTSSIFYHRYFTRVLWSIDAWKRDEPGDWNRLRKLRFLGPRAARHAEVLLKHYRERAARTEGS